MIAMGDPGNEDGTTPGSGGGGSPIDGGTSSGGGSSGGGTATGGGTGTGTGTGTPFDRLADAYLSTLGSGATLPAPANATTVVAGNADGGASINGFVIIGVLVAAGGLWYYFKHRG